MEGSLKGLFGGGEANPEHKEAARDFVQRVTTGDPTEGYSEEEAVGHLKNVLQHASPDQIQRASQQAVSNLNPNQRAEFAEMLKQRQAGQGGVQIQRAGDSGADQGGGLDDMLGGLLGSGGSGGGGGLGDILGGILGGGAGGSGGAGGGGGLGGILGSLVGGGDDKGQSSQTGFAQAGGLGDILKSPVGKAAIAGVAAFAMKEILDKS